MKEKIVYDFAKEFTQTPGPRYRSLGEKSGEEFREDVLKKLLNQYEFVEIDGSGVTTSFNPSFLSEAFMPLAKEYGVDRLFNKVRLYSSTNPYLEEKFRRYASLS